MSRYVLWSTRFGHVLKDRMRRLIKDGILPSLHDSLESCVDCIKRKLTKIKRNDQIAVQIF